MIDQEASKTNEVWGIVVPISPGGRRMWPKAIRIKAAHRIRAGEKVKDIATEIGANQSLVAKWASATEAKKAVPAFVELARPELIGGERNATATPASITACQIQIGDTSITIPPYYPATQLTEVLRAVRDSQ